jgi:hypothetical protein
VRPHDLPVTLNDYDVGVFWIPPTHTNARFALPNKFFDFVQARLAVAVGPSVEMQRLVEKHGLGVVSRDFSVQECAESLRSLSATTVASFKKASHLASRELSFDEDRRVMQTALTDLFSSGGWAAADQ